MATENVALAVGADGSVLTKSDTQQGVPTGKHC